MTLSSKQSSQLSLYFADYVTPEKKPIANAAYINSMRKHVADRIEVLNELSEQLQSQPLRKIERLAAERCLQTLVEAAIGASTHTCKAAGLTQPNDVFAVMLKAHDVLQSHIPHGVLKGAAGMRNAIVHDYLNLDWGRIEPVIRDRVYLELEQFIQHALSFLAEQ